MLLPTYVVEDNAIVLQSVCEALEELGSVRVVGSANNAADAVEWLAGHSNDWRLVIIDLFLLQSSGLDVLKGCAGRLERQRAVVLSNYATQDLRRRCAELGADAMFDKSTEIEELIEFCSELAQT